MLGALEKGWKLLGHHKKALLCFYLTNLFVAALLILPFMEIFDRSLGPGLYREKLVEELDYDWYRLFQDRVTGFASTFAPSVMGAGPFARNLEALLDGKLTQLPWAVLSLGGLYILLNSFLLAAAVGSFALDPRGTTMREFFRTGGTFFGRFFRLTILAGLAFWFVGSWIVEPLTYFANHIANRAVTDTAAFYWNFVRYLVVLVLFLFLNMLFDYAKIKTTVEDRSSVVLAFFSSLTFCINNFFLTYGFYLFIVAIGLFWVGVYTGLEHLLPQQSWFTIALAFIWQQLFMIGRLTLKLLFYSGQMQLLAGGQSVKFQFSRESLRSSPNPENWNFTL